MTTILPIDFKNLGFNYLQTKCFIIYKWKMITKKPLKNPTKITRNSKI